MPIELSDDGQVRLLRLNFTPANTLDREAVRQMTEAIKADSTMPIVLSGSDDVFSAGVNTRSFAAYSATQRQAFFDDISIMVAALVAHAAPVIAALGGHALGGGFVLMLCADYRLCVDAPDIRLGLTEAAAGVPFPAGPLAVIQAEVPPQICRSLCLASRVVTPQYCLQNGIIDELVSAGQLAELSRSRALELAAQPAFVQVKQQLRGDLRGKLRTMVSDLVAG